MIHSSICVVLCVWVFAITDAAEPSDFLVAKWKARFHAIDDNHDNVLTDDDADAISDIFLDLYPMTEDQATTAKNALKTWWTNCIQHGEASISEQDFVGAYTTSYSANSETFKTDMENCYLTIARIFDVNGDDAISKNEFLFWTQSFGHTDDAKNDALFQKFQPIDGKVPVRDFVEFYVGLVCDENDEIVFDSLIDGA